MKKILIRLLLILIFCGIVAAFVIRYSNEKVKMNSSYVNGNTAGNLYNAGLFCESNGTVFFSNPDDSGKLYSMDADGSNLKKLCDDVATFINADSHYVYYARDNGSASLNYNYFSFHNNSLCRIPRDGGRIVVLDKDPCMYVALYGNYIYYMHYDTENATTLYKIKIDGTEKEKLDSSYQYTCSGDGQYFYYNNVTTDGSIWKYDTATDSTGILYSCNSYMPIVESDGNAYYLDADNDNALVHVNVYSGTPTTLTTDSIDMYNVYGSTIYYQKYDETNPAFCMITNSGTAPVELMAGTYNTISVTSYYIYITDYRTGQVYYTSTSNPGNFTAFHPGTAK